MIRAGKNALLLMLLLISIGGFARISPASITSALINKQLDTLQDLKLDATLPEAMQQIANQTGVRLEADPAVWELLPWGQQTTIHATILNHTLRDALAAVTQKLALQFVLGDEAVELQPMPALRRLGRRATIDDLAVLDLMSRTAFAPLLSTSPQDRLGFAQVVSSVDDKLVALKSSFAIDDRSADAAADQKISLPRNATLASALESLCQQTDTAWYPWGKTIVIVSKEQQIRSQLSKTISARYNGVDVAQVLLELSQRANVDFTVDPGAYQKVPAQFRSIQLMLDDASVQQALESIAGYTGLAFDINDQGVHVSYAGDAATTNPATRPGAEPLKR